MKTPRRVLHRGHGIVVEDGELGSVRDAILAGVLVPVLWRTGDATERIGEIGEPVMFTEHFERLRGKE